MQILQINYRFAGSRSEFESQFGPVAGQIAHVSGLRWKIWLMNEAESRGGGIYLFDDEASVRAYLDGPVVAALKAHPAFSELCVQTFSVLDELTAVTRGPFQSP